MEVVTARDERQATIKSCLIDYENLHPGEVRKTRFSSYQFPITVRTSLADNIKTPSQQQDEINIHNEMLTLQKCFQSERIRCATHNGDSIYIPKCYVHKLQYTPIYTDSIFVTVSNVLSAKIKNDLRWIVVTAQFYFKDELFHIGCVFEIRKKSSLTSIRKSFQRKSRYLEVIRYHDKRSFALPMDIVGNFMKCDSPEFPTKRYLREIVHKEKFPFLLQFTSNTDKNCNKKIMFAVEELKTDIFISCLKQNGSRQILVFSAELALNLEILPNEEIIDEFDRQEIESVRCAYITNYISNDLNFKVKCSYRKLGINRRHRAQRPSNKIESCTYENDHTDYENISDNDYLPPEQLNLQEAVERGLENDKVLYSDIKEIPEQSSPEDGAYNNNRKTIEILSKNVLDIDDNETCGGYLKASELSESYPQYRKTSFVISNSNNLPQRRLMSESASNTYKPKVPKKPSTKLQLTMNDHTGIDGRQFINSSSQESTISDDSPDTDEEYDTKQAHQTDCREKENYSTIKHKFLLSLKLNTVACIDDDNDDDKDDYENADRINIHTLTTSPEEDHFQPPNAHNDDDSNTYTRSVRKRRTLMRPILNEIKLPTRSPIQVTRSKPTPPRKPIKPMLPPHKPKIKVKNVSSNLATDENNAI